MVLIVGAALLGAYLTTRHCQLEQARDVFCPGWSVVWESAQAAVTVRQTAKDRDRKNR
jgi:hypothetical protein